MITSEQFTYTKFNFPTGEMQVKVILEPWVYLVHTPELSQNNHEINLTFIFEKNEDLIELLLVADALNRLGLEIGVLKIPYIPFSRQDRINQEGESFSLVVFCNLINSLNARCVSITDPHSDVTPALLKNVQILQQHQIFEHYFVGVYSPILICPDAGALKKIYKLANCQTLKSGNVSVVECSKLRDTSTGEISGVQVHADDLGGKDCYIVDDICDGGRTFIEIAKVLKTKNCGKIILMVSHGFFTKGLEVFDGLIDEIYTAKGKLKG